MRGTTPIVENQMEKNMDNEMETEIIQGLGFPKIRGALMSRGFVGAAQNPFFIFTLTHHQNARGSSTTLC